MIAGLRHVIRRRAERVLWPGGRALILLYHRIAEPHSDPYGLCVAPSQFDEHLRAIRAVGHPMHLHELARAVSSGTVPDKAIAVTFDDGYLDNADAALPLLDTHDVPATIFATTGPGGRQREFWWDELERVFFGARPCSTALECRLGEKVHRWEFGDDESRTQDLGGRHDGWRLFEAEPPTPYHAAFREAYVLLNPLPESERTTALTQLSQSVGIDTSDVRAERRTMTPQQMATVDASGLVRIEAHTVHHPSLPSQTPAVQHEEMRSSKHTLEDWLGRQVTGFAYPYGHVDAQAVAAARETGFDYACACTYRSAWPRSDHLMLPRIEVPACDGDTLTELLQWQLH